MDRRLTSGSNWLMVIGLAAVLLGGCQAEAGPVSDPATVPNAGQIDGNIQPTDGTDPGETR